MAGSAQGDTMLPGANGRDPHAPRTRSVITVPKIRIESHQLLICTFIENTSSQTKAQIIFCISLQPTGTTSSFAKIRQKNGVSSDSTDLLLGIGE